MVSMNKFSNDTGRTNRLRPILQGLILIWLEPWVSMLHLTVKALMCNVQVPCQSVWEARALLGRLKYQKGNIEVALHAFEGIDIAAVTPRMKGSISRRCEQNRRRSQSDSVPPMSMHAVSLLLEAVLLKAKSLQGLGRYEEAAQSSKVILDTVESALPDGLPENFTSDCKLQDTLSRAVESLPEFWSSAIRIIGGFFTVNQCIFNLWHNDFSFL
ncbi:protein NPGR2-like [Humulus lupulus]|uniref:protein NPGR2-like n=1 Tax=Humulus lupulus TaxID=3486 RepID=UPI002B40CBCF|nr:protein NPGR2-like [Humulus lupulus]